MADTRASTYLITEGSSAVIRFVLRHAKEVNFLIPA